MEELCDKYQEALSNDLTTVFKIQDFKSTELPIFIQSKPFIFQTLKEYEQDKGFIRIEDDTVTVTSKGCLKLKNPDITGTEFHPDLFRFKDIWTVVNPQLFNAHFTIITGQSASSETFLATLPKTLTLFCSLPSLDKPLLPIIMKSTLSLLATLTIPSAVDPIPNVNRILIRSFLAVSILFFNIDSLPALRYLKICVLAFPSAAFSLMYFRIESDCNSLRSIM